MKFRARYVHPCWICGAPDSHGEDHQRGCPTLAPMTQERMLAIALECEAGWNPAAAERAKNERRRREASMAIALVRANEIAASTAMSGANDIAALVRRAEAHR